MRVNYHGKLAQHFQRNDDGMLTSASAMAHSSDLSWITSPGSNIFLHPLVCGNLIPNGIIANAAVSFVISSKLL